MIDSTEFYNYELRSGNRTRREATRLNMSRAGSAEAGITWRRRWRRWPHLGLDQPLKQLVELRQPPPRLLRRLPRRRRLLAPFPRRREADYLATRPPSPLTQGSVKNRREPASADGARGERTDWQLHRRYLPEAASAERSAADLRAAPSRAGVDNDDLDEVNGPNERSGFTHGPCHGHFNHRPNRYNPLTTWAYETRSRVPSVLRSRFACRES